MPSPSCQVKDGAAAYVATTNGVNVTAGATITINLVSSSGVTSWGISCIGTDDLSLTATVNASLVINAITKTATFVAPVAGRAYIFRSVVNGGIGPNGVADPSYATTFAVFTRTTGGARVLAVNQTMEGDALFGWSKDFNDLIRNAVSIPLTSAAGDVFYYDGANIQKVAGTKTDGFGIFLIGGVPTWAASGTIAVDPDTLTWLGAWGPAYAASPWVGKETPAGSTGTVSGGRNATATGVAPSVGTINSLNVPSFNGTTTDLTMAGFLGDYVAAATGLCSGFVVFNPTTAAADDAVNPYVNPPLIGENAGVWNVSFSSAGFGFSFTTGAGVKRAIVARAVGTTAVGLFRYDGVNIEVSVDFGVTWVSEPATWSAASTSLGARTPYIGRGNANFFNGRIGEVYITNTALTRTQLKDIAAHRKTKFAAV